MFPVCVVNHGEMVFRICRSGITLRFLKTLTVKLSDPLFAEIKAVACASKVAKSEIVRERLERTQRVKGSLRSRMEDLVIQSDSLQHNLSSNKDHLRKYGKSTWDESSV